MHLGMFMMPLHRPEKPWAQALAEDREAIIMADRLGYSEVWIGEHFSTKAEQIPSPMMFMATLIERTSNIRLGTGVVNLPHHNPIIVAAEAAMFDQLSGGRLMLGVGPGGLVSDAELFGERPMGERYAILTESVEIMRRLWTEHAPFTHAGDHFNIEIADHVWHEAGIGLLTHPLQQPHPPIALAMVGPGGPTAVYIAEQDFIPISANFVPAANAKAQWAHYAQARERLGKPAERDIWRVCRNVVITESDAEAAEMLDDPDGTLAFYFRYLRGNRRIAEIRTLADQSPAALNEFLEVPQAYEDCVIAGSEATVLERLVDLVDDLGPFGTLTTVAHDWDESGVWQRSMERVATRILPRLSQHADSAASAA